MMTEKFQFLPLYNSDFPSFLTKVQDVKSSLHKWSMLDCMSVQAFTFDLPYKSYLMESFVQDFLSSPEVILNLKKYNRSRHLVPIGIPAEKVRMQHLKCSMKTMNVFDKLSQDEGVVHKNGTIQKCIDDFATPWIDEGDTFEEPLPVGNELRKMFLNEESDFSNLFTNEEKREFLLRIFQHLVIGGSLCQYEDMLQPYLTATKSIYKELVSVQLDEEGSTPVVISEVIQVLSVHGREPNDTSSSPNLIFDKAAFNNFFYLVIDPGHRTVKTFYHYVC